jgi:hypothetical protein
LFVSAVTPSEMSGDCLPTTTLMQQESALMPDDSSV